MQSRRAVILDTKGAIELIVPGFEKPVGLYLDPGWMVPADIQRKVEQISQAESVVVPANIGIEACRGVPAAPEFETALKSFEPPVRGKFFDVYQRASSSNLPAAR